MVALSGLISVVIPAHKRSDLLRRCLTSLCEASGSDELSDVIVVENGDRGDIQVVCDEFRAKLPLCYLYQVEGNAGLARNTGQEAATGRLVIFIDDDTRVTSQFLESYAQAYALNGDAYFYGGPLIADYEAPPLEWLLPFLPASAKGFSLSHGAIKSSDPLFLGGNFAVPKSLLATTKGFDILGPKGASNSGFIGEETRLQQALISKGARGYFVSAASVLHWVPRNQCTVDWLIARRIRSGRTDARLRIHGGSRLLGFPKWMMKAFLVNLVKVSIAQLQRRRPETYMRHRLAFAYYRGYMAESLTMRSL